MPNISAQRVATVITGAVVGALGGGLLAGFGSCISSSPIAATLTISAGGILGACIEDWGGALMGAIGGGLLVAFGSAIGGTVLGGMLTMTISALLFGWLGWEQERSASRSWCEDSDPGA